MIRRLISLLWPPPEDDAQPKPIDDGGYNIDVWYGDDGISMLMNGVMINNFDTIADIRIIDDRFFNMIGYDEEKEGPYTIKNCKYLPSNKYAGNDDFAWSYEGENAHLMEPHGEFLIIWKQEQSIP